MAARILVADDSVTMQKVVELTFSREDFVLVQARSGEEAIRKAKEARPDLVLLDLVMPDKNGYEVCAALRAEPGLRAVPIILLTGTFEPFDPAQGTRVGANDFVTKPFESQVLISKVKQLLFSKTVDLGSPAGVKLPTPVAVPRPAPAVVPAAPPRVAPAPRTPGIAPPSIPAPAPPVVRPSASPPAMGRPLSAPPAPPIQVPPARPPAPPAPPSVTRAAEAPPQKPTPPPSLAPAAASAVSDLSPPTEEISQTRVWGVMDAVSTPAASRPGDFSELNLEEIAPLPTSMAVEQPQIEVAAPPATLSLEELLAPLPGAFPRAEPPSPVLEASPAQPAFDLTGEMEAPSLPLVEVGTGAPPPLSAEQFLGPAEPAVVAEAESATLPELELEPGPAIAPVGEAIFDLTGEMEAPPLPLVEVGTGAPPPLSAEQFLGPAEPAVVAEAESAMFPELELEPGPAIAPVGEAIFDLTGEMEAPPLPLVEVETGAPPPLAVEDFLVRMEPEMPEPAPLEPPEAAPEVASVAPGEAEPATLELPGLTTPLDLEAATGIPQEELELPELIVPAAPVVEAPAAVPPAEPVAAALLAGAEPDMARMRQAVTERVAHDLSRDLRDQLLERIERVVWEVVPDLAEALITKEIERIRALAEGKPSS